MRILRLAPLLIASACGPETGTAPGISIAREQLAQVPGFPGPVRIEGELETWRQPYALGTQPRHDIIVRVNGMVAIVGPVRAYSDTDLAGQFQNIPLAMRCMPRDLVRADRQFVCALRAADRTVAALAFRVTSQGPRPPVGEPVAHAGARPAKQTVPTESEIASR